MAAMHVRPEDLAGKVVTMSRDQDGCRLLQQKLDDGHARIRDMVFQETLPHLPELMVDPFGNYLFQKLLEHCDITARLRILDVITREEQTGAGAGGVGGGAALASANTKANEAVSAPSTATGGGGKEHYDSKDGGGDGRGSGGGRGGSGSGSGGGSGGGGSSQRAAGTKSGAGRRISHLVRAALNLHGTRSVQKLVDVCRHPEEVDLLVQALVPWVVHLATDSNGNHVIQRCLAKLPIPDREFVINAVQAQCLVVARHRHGCCVLQRCLDAGTEAQRQSLTAEITQHALLLMQDPFGNYVIQYVLEKGAWENARTLMHKLPGHVLELSKQKFASNVMEKCLTIADEHLRAQLVRELCATDVIGRLLHDKYGNYVVQRALMVSSSDLGMQLVAAIRPHMASIANTAGGRRIKARIAKKFPEHVMLFQTDEDDAPPHGAPPHGAPPAAGVTTSPVDGSNTVLRRSRN